MENDVQATNSFSNSSLVMEDALDTMASSLQIPAFRRRKNSGMIERSVSTNDLQQSSFFPRNMVDRNCQSLRMHSKEQGIDSELGNKKTDEKICVFGIIAGYAKSTDGEFEKVGRSLGKNKIIFSTEQLVKTVHHTLRGLQCFNGETAQVSGDEKPSNQSSGSQSYESLEVVESSADVPTVRENDSMTIGLSGALTVITKVNSLLASARDKLLGRRWIPTDHAETVIVPEDLAPDCKIVYPENFAPNRLMVVLLKSDKSNEQYETIYHLVYAKNGHALPTMYSIYRCKDIKEAHDLFHKCYDSLILFDTINPERMKVREGMEKIFRKIKTRPLYQTIHIAIACDRVDYFGEAVVEMLRRAGTPIETQFQQFCICEGCFPLQLAIRFDRYLIVARMLQLKADVMIKDWHGNSVLHTAALNSVRMLELLWSETPQVLPLIDEINHDGHTPIIVAVRAGNPRITSTLLGFGAKLAVRGVPRSPLFEAMNVKNSAGVVDVLVNASPEVAHERDVFGNTAIHVAAYKESLAALLAHKTKFDFDLDSRNHFGETPLHCFVRKATAQTLPLVMLIVSHGCNVNDADNHGDTALHKAVVSRNVNPLSIRFLLCAGANPNKVNMRGESPRHIAARIQNIDAMKDLIICGATRCAKDTSGCVSDCVNLETRSVSDVDTRILHLTPLAIDDYLEADYEGATLDHSEKETFNERLAEEFAQKPRKMVNLLSMDGGGIRGLVIIQTMLEIERRLGEPLFPYFDWVAGTSTGSLIAAALSKGLSLQQLLLSYIRFKDQVFEGFAPPFDTRLLETFIKEQIGEGPISDLKYPRLMVSAVNALRFPVKLEFMRNYSPNDVDASEEIPLWVALRRSTSAPVFFNPCDEYIDGGIIANNPTLDLLTEVQKFNSKAKLQEKKEDHKVEINVVLSLGTGQIPLSPMMPLLLDSARPLQSMLAFKNLSMIFVDQATASEGAPVTRSRAWCDALSVPFFRLSAHLSHAVQLCTTNDVDVVTMMWDTLKYCRKNQDYLDQICAMLKHDPKHVQRGSPFAKGSTVQSYMDGTPAKQHSIV
ncbi:unnamed protein product [Caenorhabditis auriculariae]|uniref:phospholipase A2 n=1 Tax=Caenorhabditis auriculariae TaxID=2777116 RepID=A0A8S1H5Z0_9PELO|nr:unnamed protein product [Caenorhabditis auriculariae]